MPKIEVEVEAEWPFNLFVFIEGLEPTALDRADATYLANFLLTAVEESETLERMTRELRSSTDDLF